MPIPDTIAKAKAELEADNKWRAKEIIASSLHNYDYDSDLYSLYGEILLSMEDKLQAGRYLFFSKEYLTANEQAAVDLFTDRHGKIGHNGLINNIPDKSHNYHLLPEHVRARLIEYGASEELFKAPIRHYQEDTSGDISSCIICLVLILASIGVGFYTIIRWIFNLF